MGHADIQCLVTAAENAFLRVADAKQQLFEDAHAACMAEYISAFCNEPQRKIQTPGFGDKASERESVLADVFHGSFHGANGDADLHELIRIVGGVAQGRDMILRASALIKKLAKDHADFHAEDL